MKFLTGLMFLIALLSSMSSYAGNDVGNGGNIVACFDAQNHIKSIELLDFYEARVLRGIQIDLGPTNQSLDQVMNTLLSRLAERNPTRATHYQEWYSTFFEDANLLPGIELVEISDSHHIAVPAGCKVEQIVNQRDPEFPEDKRYTINKDLWDMLDSIGKAGLILHELIYREAIENGATDSTVVRYLNSLLSSNHFKNFSQFEYLLFQKRLFRNTDYLGSNISLNNMSYEETHVIFWPQHDVYLTTPSGTFKASKDHRVIVADNGNILNASLVSDTNFTLATKQVVSCWSSGHEYFKEISFDRDSGRLIKCQLSPKQHLIENNFDLTCTGAPIAIFTSQGHYQDLNTTRWDEDCVGKIYLAKNWIPAHQLTLNKGTIEKFVLLQDQTFPIGNGKSYTFAKDTFVVFDEIGNLTSGVLSRPEIIKVRDINLEIFSAVTFSSNGALLAANLKTPEFNWNFAGQTLKLGSIFKCSPFGKKYEFPNIEFYPNGEIKNAWLTRTSNIVSNQNPNSTKNVPGTLIHGSEDGKIESTNNWRSCK